MSLFKTAKRQVELARRAILTNPASVMVVLEVAVVVDLEAMVVLVGYQVQEVVVKAAAPVGVGVAVADLAAMAAAPAKAELGEEVDSTAMGEPALIVEEQVVVVVDIMVEIRQQQAVLVELGMAETDLHHLEEQEELGGVEAWVD